MLNGDWRSPRLVHHCYECELCAGDAEEAKRLTFAALLECDIVLSKDTRMPMMKDWGSAWHHCAQQSLGYLCHRLLPQAICLALPTYDSMLPQNLEGDSDEVQESREYLRRKSWRTRKIAEDPLRRIHWCITTWTVEPLDHLLLHVQWLDARPNALLVMSHTETSPVRVASKRLYDMLADIPGTWGCSRIASSVTIALSRSVRSSCSSRSSA